MGTGKVAEFCVVLVGPEYDLNVGMAARVMANFGFCDLRIVGAKCPLGLDAVRFSKHAVGILKRAKGYGGLRGAVADCDLVVGTTGVLKRNKGTIRSAVPLRKFCGSLGEYRGKRIALLFGREGIGLNEKEIGMCDLLVHAEADGRYPILNMSHAMAVVLYSVRMGMGQGRKVREERIGASERRALTHMFNNLVGRYKVRNPERCKVAFARVLARANPTMREGNSLLNIFRLVGEELAPPRAQRPVRRCPRR